MKARSAILTYHSLDTTGSVISVTPPVFRHHIETLRQQNTPIMPLAQALTSPGSVALTFDDGFQNFVEHALPVLQEYNLPATIFLVSGYCGRFNTWPRQPKSGIPVLQLMSWSELRQLPASIELGAHTVNHPDLSKLPLAEVAVELRGCRAAIEDACGRPVWSFAYPYGASSPAVRDIVRNEFTLACGTSLGFVGPGADPVYLPRIDAYYLDRGIDIGRLMTPAGAAYFSLRKGLRTARAWAGKSRHEY